MARRDNIAIKVDHASKSFRLPHDKQNSIKGGLISLARGKKRTYETQEVLKDISFEIKKGEFFGIVGRNGSGKSTLLKMLAGIYTTTSGDIQINGSLTPFIELGVGFNPDLTGRDNVFLNGALLGFNREEMSEMYDDIVEFAELERFMDQKLKNYSSGMQVRLAFSIAIRAQSDILLLDEVLAVGDEAFQRKCFQYFAELKRNKKTVVLVTHSMDNVVRFCDNAIMIKEGKIIERGDVKTVSELYTLSNTEIAETAEGRANKKTKARNNPFADVEVVLADGLGNKKRVFRERPEDETLNITASLTLKKDIDKDTFFSVLIKNANGEAIMRFASEDVDEVGGLLCSPRRRDRIVMSLELQNVLGEGDYFVAVSFKSVDRSSVYMEAEDQLRFSITGLGVNGYALRPKKKLTIKKTVV
ncbi:hypothetical protein CR973_01075 [Candidatus Saccharibacteria bacterium]|nr:MAG: hypothetical protein CR973_01075 [Candidatus Saccharibacteria bacterium]